MITIREGTYADIDNICDKLSVISFDEMVDCGVLNPWHAKGRARLCKEGAGLEVLFVNEQPMYALGGVYDGLKVNTWFIATEAFFKAPPSVLAAAKSHMKRFAKAHKKFIIQSFTTAKSPKLRKWFEFFGFKEHQKLENVTVFRYGAADLAAAQNNAKSPA
jgi:hypothetical protein